MEPNEIDRTSSEQQNEPKPQTPAEEGASFDTAEAAGAAVAKFAEAAGAAVAKFAEAAETAVAKSAEASETEVLPQASEPEKRRLTLSLGVFLLAICLTLVTSILLTYTLTSVAQRNVYTKKLMEQQALIDSLRGDGSPSAQNMALFDAFLDYYAYYAEDMDREAMLDAAFKAYVAASGDAYARYYTAEEYAALLQESNGNYCGIGVLANDHTLTVDQIEHAGLLITEVYEHSPALQAGLSAGDMIHSVYVDGVCRSVTELGYNGAREAIRGEAGTSVKLDILRSDGVGGYSRFSVDVMRANLEKTSVRGKLAQGDARVGIVHISEFNRNTPKQFKAQVDALLAQGVQAFVFDVRDNPGGDLQSIKAVLSYFLQSGDLILEARDKNGNVAERHTVEAKSFSGDYADCSVAENEIGMYADLEMTILCNSSTASAAEVFVAALRDHQEARGLKLRAIVGETTFGKGIMQTTRAISFGNKVGYIKLTTHAYVTQCGTSYHGKGIEPTREVTLSEEADAYGIPNLPQSIDAQLQAALAYLQFQ